MMPDAVVIVGCGMTTPVGLSAQETASSVRAATMRLTEIEWRDKKFRPFVVGIVPDEYLPPLNPELETVPLTYRETRMLRLMSTSCGEALTDFPSSESPVPVVLGLPELETQIPIHGPDMIQNLAVQTGARIDVSRSRFLAQGRASSLLGLEHAVQQLRSGASRFVLVGGVDSQIDLYVLGSLDLDNRIRTNDNADGFAPGEGAGFVLLTTSAVANDCRLPVLASVTGVASGWESGHLGSEEAHKGEGLAATLNQLFTVAPASRPITSVYSTFNGEHYWSKEFGVAAIRHKSKLADDYRMEHPADCFGDLGAAHGAVMLGLAAMNADDDMPSLPALIYASSDFGTRAAALLSTR